MSEWSLNWKIIHLLSIRLEKKKLSGTILFKIFCEKIYMYLFSHFCRFRYLIKWVIWVTQLAPKKYTFTQISGRTCLPTQVLSAHPTPVGRATIYGFRVCWFLLVFVFAKLPKLNHPESLAYYFPVVQRTVEDLTVDNHQTLVTVLCHSIVLCCHCFAWIGLLILIITRDGFK